MTSAKLFTIAVAGGLLLSSAFGLADDNKKAPPAPPAPPAAPAPAPPAPIMPPMPPMPAPALGSGVSVQFHDGKIEIAGVKGNVEKALDAALAKVAAEKDLPPEVREKLTKRLGKMRDKLGKRLDKLDATDLHQLGEQLGEMGEEIGQEMEGFSDEMEKWGEQYGKDYSKNFNFKWGKDPHGKANGHLHVQANDDDDDDDTADDDRDVSVPDPSDDDDDLKDAIKDLGDLALKPAQRDAIGKLRTDSDKQVATAKQELDRQADALKGLLANPNANDADVARAIDAVSSQEAAIRKARFARVGRRASHARFRSAREGRGDAGEAAGSAEGARCAEGTGRARCAEDEVTAQRESCTSTCTCARARARPRPRDRSAVL